MVTKEKAKFNLDLAKTRLSNKQHDIIKLKKQSIFSGVRIQDQFDVGISGIKPFRKRRKADRRSTLRQLGISQSELPMLRDEFNLRKAELDVINSPRLGDML